MFFYLLKKVQVSTFKFIKFLFTRKFIYLVLLLMAAQEQNVSLFQKEEHEWPICLEFSSEANAVGRNLDT